MSRYIDADALLKAITNKAIKSGSFYLEWMKKAEELINEQPTADVVEVKHGHWIKDRLCSTSGGTYGVRRCSVCEDYYQDIGYGWNYCPNCGADMRG